MSIISVIRRWTWPLRVMLARWQWRRRYGPYQASISGESASQIITKHWGDSMRLDALEEQVIGREFFREQESEYERYEHDA